MPPVNSAVKTRAELEKMKLKEVVNYADELGKLFVDLREELFDPVLGAVSKLRDQLAISHKVNEYLLKQLGSVEHTANSNTQYARKETLEIHGVPKSFGMEKLLRTRSSPSSMGCLSTRLLPGVIVKQPMR